MSDRALSYRRLRAAPAPLALFRRLYAKERYGFLYESLEAHGTRGRYSFLGGRPSKTLTAIGATVRLREGSDERVEQGDPLEFLRRELATGPTALPFPSFPGGAVGYLGYELVRRLAPIARVNPADEATPDLYMLFPDEWIVIDHLDETVHLACYGANGEARLDEIAATLPRLEGGDADEYVSAPDEANAIPYRSNRTREEFEATVRHAQEFIQRGDIFQVVLSQRLEFDLPAPPLDLYAALRHTNPSPYMYYLNLDGLELAGSSPEVLVKLSGRRIVSRPLAGTRPRGRTTAEDEALARELLADEKERAEHVMLVDLARNDVGRDGRPGSVTVEEYLQVERFSRVMHLVSNVSAKLRDDRDAIDLFRSCFPAGTVSGAPKVRAMQIIEELEPDVRGPYAGAIGYFSYLGDMDLCIAIRTLVCRDGRGSIQAGAGIVADSVPALEFDETLNKAQAVLDSLALAATHNRS